MRRARLLAAACAIALAGGLAACAPEADEAPTPHGPQGFELVTTYEGLQVWFDRGDETGATDIILINADGRRVGSCLGNAPTVCTQGIIAEQPIVIGIAAPSAVTAQAGWQGVLYDMQLVPGLPADGDQVFILAVPVPDPATMTPGNFAAYDAAGTNVSGA